MTTRFAYDGDQLVAEYNASNQLLRRYVHGPAVDEAVVWYEGSGTATRRWLHADERGSIVAISNASGAQFAINRYDEHGVPASTNTGRFQFTGQAWVPEVKLYYFKVRFYSASLGRFMQTDLIGYAAGMNLYAYVRGDAINLRDPTGLMEEVIVLGSCGYDCTSYDPGTFFGGYQRDLDMFRAQLEAQMQAMVLQSTGDGTQEQKPTECLPDDPPIEQVCPECYLMGVGRLAYAGLAKLIPAIGASVEESAMAQAAYAGAARNSLKDLFRGPLAPVFSGIRQPTFSASLTKYNSDPYAIIDAASRTNAAINAVGASGAALGVGLSVANQKQCSQSK